MTDRVVGEREGNEAKATEACRVGRGAKCVPSLPAAQCGGIAADGRPMLAVGDGDEHAHGGDRQCNNGENCQPGVAGSPGRDSADERRCGCADRERHQRRIEIIDQGGEDFRGR